MDNSVDWSRSDISLHRLAVFAAVIDAAGFTAAANDLEMSQPSVSYHVRQLEKALNATLVEYGNRRLSVTPEGREVYRAAVAMLNEHASLARTVESLQTGHVGRLSVGASIAFEHQFFFDDVIAPFFAANPGLSMTLRFAQSAELAAAVQGRQLDLAYVNNWRIADDLQYEQVHTSDLVFLVSQTHQLANRTQVTAADINESGLLSAPIEGSEVISYGEMLRAAGIPSPNVVMEVDGVQARKLAAETGMGVLATFVPDYAGDSAMDPLVRLEIEAKLPTIDFGLVSRRDEPWSEPMSNFAGWLRCVAGET